MFHSFLTSGVETLGETVNRNREQSNRPRPRKCYWITSETSPNSGRHRNRHKTGCRTQTPFETFTRESSCRRRRCAVGFVRNGNTAILKNPSVVNSVRTSRDTITEMTRGFSNYSSRDSNKVFWEKNLNRKIIQLWEVLTDRLKLYTEGGGLREGRLLFGLLQVGAKKFQV